MIEIYVAEDGRATMFAAEKQCSDMYVNTEHLVHVKYGSVFVLLSFGTI